MKTLQTCLIGLILLSIYFGIKDVTVEGVAQLFVEKGWGVISVLAGGNFQSPQSRPLPQNQGDDTDSIQPIEELEDIE